MDDKGINFPTFKERPEKVDIDMDILNDTIEYIRPAVQADGGDLSLIHISEPTRQKPISYAVFCLKKKFF